MDKLLTRRQAIARVSNFALAAGAGLMLPSLAKADANSYSVVATTTWATPPWGFANAPTASSSYNNSLFPIASITQGNRAGFGWGNGGNGGWASAAGVSASNPATIVIDLRNPQSPYETIDTVNVYTVQDNFTNPMDPSEAAQITATLYGLTSFEVWGQTPGGSWTLLASKTGCYLAQTKCYFSAITLVAIKIVITGTRDGYARVTAVEAISVAGSTSTMPRNVVSTVQAIRTTGDGFLLPSLAQANIVQESLTGAAAQIHATRTGGVGPTQTFAVVPKSTVWHSVDDGGSGWYDGPQLDFTGNETAFGPIIVDVVASRPPPEVASAVMAMNILPVWMTQPIGGYSWTQSFARAPVYDWLVNAPSVETLESAVIEEIAVLRLAASAAASGIFFTATTSLILGATLGHITYSQIQNNPNFINATDSFYGAITGHPLP